MSRIRFVSICLSLLIFTACEKSDRDTSGGVTINPVRELEVFIDGNEWDTDDVRMRTLYRDLSIEGFENDKQISIKLDNFDGPNTYIIDNVNSYVRYYPSTDDLTNYYYAQNDTVVISEFPSSSPFCLGSFSFTGINSLGGDSKIFSNGSFNGIDSLETVPSEIFSIELNSNGWTPKSVEVIQNETVQRISVLAQSANDNTYIVIRIPLTTTAGTYDLNNPDFTVEYQEVDGNTYTADSGTLIIAENDFFNSSLIGSFENLNLSSVSSGTSVNLTGQFDMQYD